MDLRELLKAADPIFNRNRTDVPLQRSGDVEFETRWQRDMIENEGHRIVHMTDTKKHERILVYRTVYGDGMDDDVVTLCARVFSEHGVKIPDPKMFLSYFPDTGCMEIADIRVENHDAGRGYGSALMEGMFEVIRSFGHSVKYITGWISAVDWDHVGRSVGFYTRHGFESELNHEARSGSILWVNPEAGGSVEEFKKLNK